MNNPSDIRTESWFFRGWLTRHITTVLGVSSAWIWLSPTILALYRSLVSPYWDETWLMFFAGLVIAFLVSVLFGLMIYPLLEKLLQPLLITAGSPAEAFVVLLPVQQILVWSFPILLFLDQIMAPDTWKQELYWFWLLPSLHSLVHLYRYCWRMWQRREQEKYLQDRTFIP